MGFEIRETQEDSWLRLRLRGELDMASAVALTDRLKELRGQRRSVLMDLSQLEFIDLAGLRIMITSVTSARAGGWRFRIDPDLAPPVRTLLEVSTMDQLVGTESTDA